MSAREMQLKPLCLFVRSQPEMVSQNLYHQSGPPELLFQFALFLKSLPSHPAICMMVSTLLSEPREGGIRVHLRVS